MIKPIQLFLPFCLFSLLFYGCNKENTTEPVKVSSPASGYSSEIINEWMKVAYDIVQFEDIPAPVCSRFYGYCTVAIYEAVRNGIPGSISLSGQLREMPQMPSPLNEVYDWPSVLISTLRIVSTGVLYQPTSYSLDLIETIYEKHLNERMNTVEASIVNHSLEYGKLLGNAIVSWANSDYFLETRNMPYNPPSRIVNPANWETTAQGGTAIEPYLALQRAFCMPSSNSCAVPIEINFDTIPGSPFYNEAYEIYQISKNLTQEEKNIALFWQDKTGTGQPPGHWVMITNNMINSFNLNLAESAKLFVLVGAALRDAFISAWEAKFRINLLRPRTYIREYIDPDWDEFIPTPLFPEYPSGHSVGSGAAAEILTFWFGDNVSYVDSTHGNKPGLRNRTFSSFRNAAVEASNSRMYGGTHFRTGCENGVEQGKLVANVILSSIRFE